MSAPLSVEAVILRSVPFGESDLVVHLMTREHGRLGVFARGARKSSRRFGGALQPFMLLRAELVDRRGSDLADLRGAMVVDAFLPLRDDLGRLAHAGYGVDLVRAVARDHQPNAPLFDVLVRFFTLLADAGPRSIGLRALEMAVLEAAGLSPRLDSCGRCGTGEGLLFFVPAEGAVACGGCTPPVALPVDRACLALLAALQRGGLEAAAAAEEAGLPLEPVRQILHAFLTRHLSREFPSLTFLRDVGAPP